MNRSPSYLFVASIALIALLSVSPAQATMMMSMGDGNQSRIFTDLVKDGRLDVSDSSDARDYATDFMVHTNGSTSGYVSVTNYVEDSATPFGQPQVLTDTWYRDEQFNTTTRGTSWASGPFSLTTLAAVSHSAEGAQETLFANFLTSDAWVDARDTLVLLGIGLIGSTLSRRTRPACIADASPA